MESELGYAIVEFAVMGIAQFDSAAHVHHSIIRIIGNVFAGGHFGVHFEETTALIECCVFRDSACSPITGFHDLTRHMLDYLPPIRRTGSRTSTRRGMRLSRVVKRIGANQSFGWTLACADGFLCRFLAGGVELLRVDPRTGDTVSFGDVEGIINPRELAWDGAHLWVNDFEIRRDCLG